MTSPIAPYWQLDVMGYADGQIDAARRKDIERLLARDPDLLATAQSIAMQNDAIRAAYGDRLEEDIPGRLMSVLERAEAAKRPVSPLRTAAVVALTLATGVAGWWGGELLGTPPPEDANDFVDAVATAHLDWADPTSRSISTGSPTPAAPPLEWLSERVTLELRAPTLAAYGYESVDKALTDVDGRPTVRLTFERGDGNAISLFLSTRWRELPPTFNLRPDAGASSVYWFDGPLIWVLTGTLEPSDLAAMAEAIHETTRLRPAPAGRPSIRNNIVDLDTPAAGKGVPR